MILLFFCELKNNKSVRMITASSIASVLLVSLATSQIVQAEEAQDLHPWLTSKHQIDIGVFYRRNEFERHGQTRPDFIIQNYWRDWVFAEQRLAGGWPAADQQRSGSGSPDAPCLRGG